MSALCSSELIGHCADAQIEFGLKAPRKPCCGKRLLASHLRILIGHAKPLAQCLHLQPAARKPALSTTQCANSKADQQHGYFSMHAITLANWTNPRPPGFEPPDPQAFKPPTCMQSAGHMIRRKALNYVQSMHSGSPSVIAGHSPCSCLAEP